MPILSYLAFPARGKFDELCRALSSLPGCEPTPSDGRELIVLVTDTPNPAKERELQRRMSEIDSLASLALVYASTDDEDGPPGEAAPC